MQGRAGSSSGDCLRSDGMGPCFEALLQKASSLLASKVMFWIRCQRGHQAASGTAGTWRPHVEAARLFC